MDPRHSPIPVEPFCVTYLKQQLQERQRRNPRYSLRIFARHLRIDPSTFSRIQRGLQTISLPAAKRIVTSLRKPLEDKRRFLRSVDEEQKRLAEGDLAKAIEDLSLVTPVRVL